MGKITKLSKLYNPDELDDVEDISKSSNNKFINRELSWVDFNRRVLECAKNKHNPIKERLNFLAITNSNLNEFISVRLSSAISETKEDSDIVNKLLKEIKSFFEEQKGVFKSLLPFLNEFCNISFSSIKKLERKTLKKIKDRYEKELFPLLTPINVNNGINSVPNINNGQLAFAVIVKDGDEEILNIITLHDSVPQVYVEDGKMVLIEDIILAFMDKLFVNKKIVDKGYFKLFKDGNVILQHDKSKFILERMEETIHRRAFSNPIFMQVSSGMSDKLNKSLRALFGLKKKFIQEDVILDYSRFSKLPLPKEYSYEPFEPAELEVADNEYSLLSTIKNKDLLLHHPYDSYDTVVKFIQHAASDPDVVCIKQTLYRVSSLDSPIVNALCSAAKSGKNVSVLIEIKARFDESRNIALVSKLEAAGVNVILGLEWLKTHCKMCVVLRKEDDGLTAYSHVATGNYNDKTARIYTDISVLTANQKVGRSLLNIFNIISGVSAPNKDMDRVFYSPVNIRSNIYEKIDECIKAAKKGKKASITIKVNAISDKGIVDKLYDAAKNDVAIYIICRGACSIVPKKNIYIKSIVGRFLEHARIYKFTIEKDSDYYISSADLLTRNLDKRVEIMLSIKDDNCIQRLNHILEYQMKDKANSFTLSEDAKWSKTKGDFDCHQEFINDAKNTSPIVTAKKKKK